MSIRQLGTGLFLITITTLFLLQNSTALALQNPVSDTLLQPSEEFIASELIVMLKEGTNESDIRANKSLNTHKLTKIARSNIFKLELNDTKLREMGISTKGQLNTKEKSFNIAKYRNMLSEIKSNPSVLLVEPNYVRKPIQFTGIDIETEETLEIYPLDTDDLLDTTQERAQSNGRTIRIAILDTHINGEHPILSSSILRDGEGKVIGYDFIEEDANPFSADGLHGSFVASRVAGKPDASSGFPGGASISGCKIIPITICTVSYCSISAELEGINFAADNGADIINMSYGGEGNSVITEYLIEEMYREKGIVFVSAAGNKSTTTRYYPAANTHVIAVGALDETGKVRANYSNYGDWVDIAAPGTNVKGLYGDKVVDGYGTSYSAPFVAGIIGKYLQNSNTQRGYQIEKILRTDGHIDFTSAPTVGKGIVDYKKMVDSVVNKIKTVYPVGNFLDFYRVIEPSNLIWIPFKIKGGMPERYKITIKDSSGVLHFKQNYVMNSQESLTCHDLGSLSQRCILNIRPFVFRQDIKYYWTITGYRVVDGVTHSKELPPVAYKLKTVN